MSKITVLKKKPGGGVIFGPWNHPCVYLCVHMCARGMRVCVRVRVRVCKHTNTTPTETGSYVCHAIVQYNTVLDDTISGANFDLMTMFVLTGPVDKSQQLQYSTR